MGLWSEYTDEDGGVFASLMSAFTNASGRFVDPVGREAKAVPPHVHLNHHLEVGFARELGQQAQIAEVILTLARLVVRPVASIRARC